MSEEPVEGPPGWSYKDIAEEPYKNEQFNSKEKALRTTYILDVLNKLISNIESNKYTINEINRIYMQVQQLKFD